MLDKLFRSYLRLSRKEYLIPFLESLVNVGRPTSVFFPNELFEQGMSLILSGLNNTMAIQSNLDWIWPLWCERQQSPDDAAFIPTGVNLITANLSLRNWTSLGLPDSPRECMLDPVGMLTLHAFGWSVFPYVKVGDVGFYPPRMAGQVTQSLKNSHLPWVMTHYRSHPELEWNSETLALRCAGEEMAIFLHKLENRGTAPLSLTFGLSIRPYNVLTMGHINRIHYKNRLWRLNRKPGLLMMEEPDSIRISDRHRGDPIFGIGRERFETQRTSKSGILGGVAEFRLQLAPGEKRTYTVAGTLAPPETTLKRKFRHVHKASLTKAMKESLKTWRSRETEGMSVDLPERALNNAFLALKSRMHVFDDGTHFTPGTFFYHYNWIRDSSFIALAFDQLGLHREVGSKIPGLLRLQTKDGFFRSQNGEWDSTGQAIFTIVGHVLRTGKVGLLGQCYPALLKGVRWTESMRRPDARSKAPHAGLLPAGFSAEHFGPNDHYFWDNFWNLKGMDLALHSARILGKRDDAEWIESRRENYHDCISAAMGEAIARVGTECLPCSPYRYMDCAAIGNLVALTPLGLFGPDTPWMKPTVKYLYENHVRQGLFFQKIIHTGLNPYLSVQLAKAMLVCGDDRWRGILDALLDHASGTYTWPEAIHPVTGGGCMGDGDHGWAVSEVLCLIRDMLVREQDDELILASGVPLDWYQPGKAYEVKRAPTLFGEISYQVKRHPTSLEISWSLRRNPIQRKAPVFLLLPKALGLHGSESDPGSRVKIPLERDEGYLSFRKDAEQDDFMLSKANTEERVASATLLTASIRKENRAW